MYNIFNFTFANNVKRYIFTKSGAKLQQKSHIRKFFCIYFIKITGYIQSIYKVVWDTILVRCASDMPLIRLLCVSLMVFLWEIRVPVSSRYYSPLLSLFHGEGTTKNPNMQIKIKNILIKTY